jgi:hypothetical protein
LVRRARLTRRQWSVHGSLLHIRGGYERTLLQRHGERERERARAHREYAG